MPPILAAAGVAAAGGLASAAIGSSAAKSAANSQVQASNNALALQNQIYNTTRGDLLPYNQGGQGAFNSLLGLTSQQAGGGGGYGFGNESASQVPTGGSTGFDPNAFLQQHPELIDGYQQNKQNPAYTESISDFAARQYREHPDMYAYTPAAAAGGAPSGAGGGGVPTGPTGGALNSPLLAPYPQQVPQYSSFESHYGNAPTYSPYDIATPQYTPFNMTESELQKTPGYQFNLTQGLKAVQNSAAARGLGVSGAAQKGAANFATGLADSTYQNQFANYVTNYQNKLQGQQAGLGQHVTDYQNALNNYLSNFNVYSSDYANQLAGFNTGFGAYSTQQQNQYNRLLGIAGLGEGAAAQQGNFATQQSGNMAGTLTGIGNAQAGGTIGSANALAGGISGAFGGVGNALLYNQLLKGQGVYGTGSQVGTLYSNPLTLAPNTLINPNTGASITNSYMNGLGAGVSFN